MNALRLSLLLLSLALLVACPPSPGDDDDASNSLCNGERDVGEFTTDDTYDADGDGYFDPADPGCAETYGEDELDCDEDDPLVNPGEVEVECNDKDDDCDPSTADGEDADDDGYSECGGDCDDDDPDVHPGAEEIACNGIDEDCNGADGEPCDTDYTGVWSVDPAVAYTCGSAQVGFQSIAITQDHDELMLTPDNCPSCTGPTQLPGLFDSENHFAAEQTIDAGSGCEKLFTMNGWITSANEFNGSLAINFVGADCSGDCGGQNLSFTATRD
jgi:hypothetical protein